MKSPASIQQKFDSVARHWLSQLDTYTEEQFRIKPRPDEWSIGQVYEHLTTGTFRFHLRHIDNCVNEKGEGGSKTLPGRIVYFIGSFPKRRIKVPATPEYTPNQPQSIASVRANLGKLIVGMKAVTPRIESSPTNSKTRHPRLGALNAREWYQLIEMHFRHHLQQKERLDKFLGMNQ